MSRRCCCGCPSGEYRFSTTRSTFYDDQGDEVDISTITFDADGNAQLPIGYSVALRVVGVSNYDAWEAILGVFGGVEVEFDYIPDDDDSPGAIVRYIPSTSFNVSYDGTTDGGTVLSVYETTDTTTRWLNRFLFRHTPKYVAAQYRIVEDATYPDTPGSLIKPMQLGAVETDQLGITGWVKITAKEAVGALTYVRVGFIEYNAIPRNWTGGSHYYYGTFEEPCSAPTPFAGSIYEVWDLHRSSIVAGRDALFVDRLYNASPGTQATISSTFLGDFVHPHCWVISNLGTFDPTDETLECTTGDGVSSAVGYSRVHDPPPNDSNGNLWPTPTGKVGLLSCLSYQCRENQGSNIVVSCNGIASQDEEIITYYPLPTYRAGWSIELDNDGVALCASPCDQPTDYATGGGNPTEGPVYKIDARYDV